MSGGTDHDKVRSSYDAVAEEYAAHFADELSRKPLDRALLRAVVEDVGTATPVADLGCGPGHVAAFILGLGVPAVAIDLSPAMVELGRSTYPGVEFRRGDLLDLPAADGEFGAVVAFYSIIHLAAAEVGDALAEMTRAVRPGGLVLVSFHIGAEVVHRDDWWGQPVDLDFRMLDPDDVARLMENAGLHVEARLVREPYEGEAETRRAYLLARRPTTG